MNTELCLHFSKSNPELAEAAERSPERFAQLMQSFQQQHCLGAQQRRIDEELLHSDPFDIEGITCNTSSRSLMLKTCAINLDASVVGFLSESLKEVFND